LLNSDSPQAGVNVIAVAALLQDSREVWMATASCRPNRDAVEYYQTAERLLIRTIAALDRGASIALHHLVFCYGLSDRECDL
jgi:hypothetical protein